MDKTEKRIIIGKRKFLERYRLPSLLGSKIFTTLFRKSMSPMASSTRIRNVSVPDMKNIFLLIPLPIFFITVKKHWSLRVPVVLRRKVLPAVPKV